MTREVPTDVSERLYDVVLAALRAGVDPQDFRREAQCHWRDALDEMKRHGQQAWTMEDVR